jgi:Outer membrane protein beta-barrel domain
MRHLFILGAIAAIALNSASAHADDAIGLYAGAAAGQANVQASDSHFSGDSFKENHTAFKVMVGVRPLPTVGGELEYVRFGHPNGQIDHQPADVSMRGAAGFAVFYLPIPVVNLYGKIGLARIQSTLNETNNGELFRFDRINTDIAAGVGLQAKFGPLAIRAEGEVFSAEGSHPRLLSIGATWTFL